MTAQMFAAAARHSSTHREISFILLHLFNQIEVGDDTLALVLSVRLHVHTYEFGTAVASICLRCKWYEFKVTLMVCVAFASYPTFHRERVSESARWQTEKNEQNKNKHGKCNALDFDSITTVRYLHGCCGKCMHATAKRLIDLTSFCTGDAFECAIVFYHIYFLPFQMSF